MTTEESGATGSITITTNSKGEKQVTVKCRDIRNEPHKWTVGPTDDATVDDPKLERRYTPPSIDAEADHAVELIKKVEESLRRGGMKVAGDAVKE